MKKLLLYSVLALFPIGTAAQSYARVGVHDPSVVWEPASQTYYIFGSHRQSAKSTDLMNWTQITAKWGTSSSTNAGNSAAFVTPAVKKVMKGGMEVDFPAFNAHDWSAAVSQYGDAVWGSIDGNMWAPDVIWNKAMNKWCMYLSVNGVEFNSSIILLTADNIEGPYYYQGPVVISGFNIVDALDYKKTDLELAIGEQTALPDRYNKGRSWGGFWPHCIDPCVFYDEEGKLWMTYGSWSNGIWILELDEETGLRDYNVADSYGNDSSRGINTSKDPYYGTKIAGGRGHSGEASYVEHIGDYYYLFVTYGGLVANGGYQMRVFRSQNPNGPFTDSKGTNAILTTDPRNGANFGPGGLQLGENIFGAYGNWGYQAAGINGERSQGHNSIIDAEDGRTYMVYHTRFQGRGEEHEVRVHQVFLNKEGWLCAAPFEYSGETFTNADIANSQLVPSDKIAGSYNVLIHRYGMNHGNMELGEPVSLVLSADGTIKGSVTGSWSTDGGSYITINLDGKTYSGVMVEQTLEPSTDTTPAFTAMCSETGETVWGYKAGDGTTTTLGATNNTTPYLTVFSEALPITEGETAVFEFTNYTSKAAWYHNWVAVVSKTSTFNYGDALVLLRADNWENIQNGNTGVSSNYNWDTFSDDMDGSSVVLTFAYKNGSVAIHADITSANGKKFSEDFTKSGISGTVYCSLTLEKAHLEITRAEVVDASGISTVTGNKASNASAVYNLAGQRVGSDYRGLIITNGRKLLKR